MPTVDSILDGIDNYDQSVNASLALVHLFIWDDSTEDVDSSVHFWFGRKFEPGGVTPDILIQLDGSKGIITELKRSFPQVDAEGEDLWAEEFDQLKRYDKELVGWDTSNGKVHSTDLILFTSQKFGTRVVDYIAEKGLTFQDYANNFAILQFNPASGRKAAVFIQKVEGDIHEFKNITNQRLREGVTIGMGYLLSSGLSSVKLLDYRPEKPVDIVYLMSLMWIHIFGTVPTEDDWRCARESKEGKIVEIPVKIDEVKTRILEGFALNNSHKVLDNSWINECMESLVTLNLARRAKRAEDADYVIKYRKKLKPGPGGEEIHKVFAEMLFGGRIQTRLETGD
ncbi:MAG: hypothetical protein KKA79_06785 [Nanoarchaeota archaeon]|nr:hypothetical protein [Nanoarchaeota archaeon]